MVQLLWTNSLAVVQHIRELPHHPTITLGTGIPHLSKVPFMPLHFYKRPVLIPVFANQRNQKKDFHLYKKR